MGSECQTFHLHDLIPIATCHQSYSGHRYNALN